MRTKEEIIRSVMIGHAVGDALGVPVEFCTREELRRRPVTDMMGYGSYPVPAGAWSDDTSMSLGALDVLADGDVRYDKMMENFVKWCDCSAYTPTGEMFDIGFTCRRAIQNFTWGASPLACGMAGKYDNGNGSLMRIHPFVLMVYFCRRLQCVWETVIENASSLTHAHERSILACRIYALTLIRLMEDPSKVSVRAALREAKERFVQSEEYGTYERLLAEDFAALPENEIKSSGYVVDTLEAALWCLLTTDGYEECVLRAVNLGGDTDTVAAVAGGLAGALYGYEAIPEKWRKTLIKREYIEKMCDRAAENWE
jgi:ADP-ribosylglycohydrolase